MRATATPIPRTWVYVRRDPCSPSSTVRGPTGTLRQDTRARRLRRCRGLDALSASQRVGGSRTLHPLERADTPSEEILARSTGSDGRTPCHKMYLRRANGFELHREEQSRYSDRRRQSPARSRRWLGRPPV